MLPLLRCEQTLVQKEGPFQRVMPGIGVLHGQKSNGAGTEMKRRNEWDQAKKLVGSNSTCPFGQGEYSWLIKICDLGYIELIMPFTQWQNLLRTIVWLLKLSAYLGFHVYYSYPTFLQRSPGWYTLLSCNSATLPNSLNWETVVKPKSPMDLWVGISIQASMARSKTFIY